MPKRAIHDMFAIKTSHYIIMGFAITSGLAWRDLIHAVLKRVSPVDNAVLLNLIYAILITMLLVFVIWILPDTIDELPIEVRERLSHP